MIHRRVAVLTALVSACAATRLPAPAEPAPILSPIAPASPPGPGLSRAYLDAVDGPSLVERVRGASVGGMAGAIGFSGSIDVSTRLCVTPCTIDLAPGPYELRFTSVDDADRTSTGYLNVGTGPIAYRHALGRHETHGLRRWAGWTVLAVGVLVDLAVLGATDGPHTDDDARTIQHDALLGAGITLLGGYLVYTSRDVEQAGAGTAWQP